MLRKNEGKMFTGVCSGISAQVGLNPNVIRLLFAAFTFLTAGTLVLVYVVLWLALRLDTTEKTGLEELGDLFNQDSEKETPHSNYPVPPQPFPGSSADNRETPPAPKEDPQV